MRRQDRLVQDIGDRAAQHIEGEARLYPPQVLPRQEVVVAPPPVVGPALIEREVALPTYRPPIVAADEEVAVRPAAAVYAVGSVLPPNVPLYAMPQNVALSVPATQTYSYAYLGGHAYLVDPASGIIVADVTE